MRQVRRVHKDLPTCMAAVMAEMYGRHTSAASAQLCLVVEHFVLREIVRSSRTIGG